MNGSSVGSAEKAEGFGAEFWPVRGRSPELDYAWRLYRVADARNKQFLVLAVGTQESGEVGRERIDLKACLLDTARFGDWRTTEEVCVMSAYRTCGLKLTNGFVVVEQDELRSLNVGSLCFNEIVKWARRVAPDDEVLPIKLLGHHVHSYGKENVERRYRFYRRFGVDFELEEQDGLALASGKSKPLAARELVSHSLSRFSNIVELDVAAVLQQLSMKQGELTDDMLRLEGAVSRLLEDRRKISDRVSHAAAMARWPLVCAAFIAGAILSRPGHFGLHF